MISISMVYFAGYAERKMSTLLFYLVKQANIERLLRFCMFRLTIMRTKQFNAN